jgi:hypothetical protein
MLAVDWTPRRSLVLSAALEHLQRSSSDPLFDFHSRVFSLALTLTL